MMIDVARNKNSDKSFLRSDAAKLTKINVGKWV